MNDFQAQASITTASKAPDRLSWENCSRWLGAIILAVFINAVLFSIIPSLISEVPDRGTVGESLQAVNFIRMTPPEKPPEPKKPPEKDIQPPKKPAPQALRTKIPRQAPDILKHPALQFEINPKLPAGPVGIAPLSIAMVDIGPPPMKDAYEIGEIDRPLTPVSKMPPLYPLRAKRMGIEGWVKVGFLVTETGLVDQIKIIDSHPETIFDRTVMQCVSTWRFSPGTVQGVPVKTRAITTVKFTLEN